MEIDLQTIINEINKNLESDVLLGIKQVETHSECKTLLKNRQTNLLDYKGIPVFLEIFKIIEQKIFKLGIIHNYKTSNEHYNISFYNCLLHLIIDKYDIYTIDEQYMTCNTLLEYVYGQLYGNHKKMYRYLNWNISDVISDMKKYKVSDKIIQIICNLLDINLFIFNYTKKELECYYSSNFNIEEHKTNNELKKTKNDEIYTRKSKKDKIAETRKRQKEENIISEQNSMKFINFFKKNYFISMTDIFYEPIIFEGGDKYLSFPNKIIKNMIKNFGLITWKRPEKKKKKTEKETVDNVFIPELFYSHYDYIYWKDIKDPYIVNHIIDKKLSVNI